jgi:hypothetical protein
MLVSVALIAASIVVTRDYRNLHNARAKFQQVAARYEVGRVTAEDVVNASKELMTSDSATLWISQRAAAGAHVERLKYLLAKVQSPVSESRRQDIQRRVAIIQQELQQYPTLHQPPPLP